MYLTDSNTMSKKQTTERELDYYCLYLLDYLRRHRFPQQYDMYFIRQCADEAAEIYEQERRNGHTTDQAQEMAMSVLTKGLHNSQYDILLGVIDTEFEKSVPQIQHEQLAERLLPFMGGIFSVYDLTTDDFTLTDGYRNLHDELTGAVALYIRQYGIQ